MFFTVLNNILLGAYLVQNMCMKGICDWVLIKTLNQPLIDWYSTLHCHLHQHLSWHSFKSQQIVNYRSLQYTEYMTLGRLLMNGVNQALIIWVSSYGDVDWVSTEYRLGRWLSVESFDQDIDWVSIMVWSRTSIDISSPVPLVHLIHWHNWTDTGSMAYHNQSMARISKSWFRDSM